MLLETFFRVIIILNDNIMSNMVNTDNVIAAIEMIVGFINDSMLIMVGLRMYMTNIAKNPNGTIVSRQTRPLILYFKCE